MNPLSDLDTLAVAAWTNSGRCGDEYYRVMTAWVVSRCAQGSADRCHELAMQYDKSLNTFLGLTVGLSSAITGGKNVRLARRYKSILAGDLDYFDGHRAAGA
jgi:hypothetical protein